MYPGDPLFTFLLLLLALGVIVAIVWFIAVIFYAGISLAREKARKAYRD